MITSWVEYEAPAPHLRLFQRECGDGHLTALFGREPDLKGRVWWHLSISHRTSEPTPKPGRIPTFDELKEARYRFLPDEACMAQMFPPKRLYVNHHETTLHLWEIPMEYAT